MKKGMKSVILVFLSVAMMVSLSACAAESPERMVQKYLNALVAGDIKTIEECKVPQSGDNFAAGRDMAADLTGALFGTNVSGNTMNAMGGMLLKGIFHGKEFRVTGSEISGDRADVYFDVYDNGKLSSKNEYLPAVRYNGKWYVDYTGYLF